MDEACRQRSSGRQRPASANLNEIHTLILGQAITGLAAFS
jgi:hypothetical protein